MNPEKLAKLQSNVRIGGKGTPRRKMKKVHKASGGDDKKLGAALKKLNVQPISSVEEVNMFKSDGSVLHFVAPKVQASVASNTFVISGPFQDMSLTQVISENPSILAQLGSNLQDMQQQIMQQLKNTPGAPAAPAAEDDDDVPDLVDTEDFDKLVDESKAD